MALKYKIGDKVRIKSLDWYNDNKDEYGYIDCGSRSFFTKMSDWCGKIATIKEICKTNCYRLEEYDFDWTDEMIEGLVEEEEIEFTEEDKYWCDIMSESDPTTYVLPQGYQFVDENGNVINATKIVLEKKKKEYPKTYEECRDYIESCYDEPFCADLIATGYKSKLIESFARLLICRDAYWKLYGEEMGLGKPWKPEYVNTGEKVYSIIRSCGVIKKNPICDFSKCYILEFPTKEMRDAFYENFKSEIEICKELL